MDKKRRITGFNYMTDAFGAPIPNDSNSLTVGDNGPTLLQDTLFIEKLAHFDRERIPERVVHAKGTGAFGYFENYRCMDNYTTANFLQYPHQKTKVFVRFSTVIGSAGSADSVRDPRGFAVKFYTTQGIYDIVGNNLPVFFIRDAIRFPDFIHSAKSSPDTNLKDPERFWDFISLTPESTHMITWVYSDRGTIKDYRHMDGFGVNTFIWVNKHGKRIFIKYHWKTMQGIETIDRHESDRLAGLDPNIATKNLHQAIACGNCPRWELCVQMLPMDLADCLPFDPLDDTKTWPEDQFPLIPVGMMVLNENPQNFFAEVEQSAFCPANLVPGIEFSADKMLVGRSFSYRDTQRYRLGANFSNLPVNRSICPVFNNQRDGAATYSVIPGRVNYSPNSLNRNQPYPYPIAEPNSFELSGCVKRTPIQKTDDFTQPGERYLSLTKEEQCHLVDNIAVELAQCNPELVNRAISNFCKANEEFGKKVMAAVTDYKHSR